MTPNEFLSEIKAWVEAGNLTALQILWEEYESEEFVNSTMWRMIYLHAVQHRQLEIVQWMEEVAR